MGLFKKRRRTESGAVISDRDAKRSDLAELREFAKSRAGVEAFVEPQTSVSQLSIVLVAADGESIRRRVGTAKAASDLARGLKIPIYDAHKVGYPKRMRDYNLNSAAQKSSVQAGRGKYSSAEFAAIMTLESIAGVEPLGRDPEKSDLQRVLRAARAVAHPDRRDGDRAKWDQVEQAARTLGL